MWGLGEKNWWRCNGKIFKNIQNPACNTRRCLRQCLPRLHAQLLSSHTICAFALCVHHTTRHQQMLLKTHQLRFKTLACFHSMRRSFPFLYKHNGLIMETETFRVLLPSSLCTQLPNCVLGCLVLEIAIWKSNEFHKKTIHSGLISRQNFQQYLGRLLWSTV